MHQLEVSDAFDLDDLVPIERSRPLAPGPGQVLVHMKAVALNYRDLLVATGYDRWRPPVGRVPGSDGVGIVVEIGPQVTRFKVGDRVMTTILPNWVSGPLTVEKRSGALGGPSADGVLAEFVLLDAEGVVHAPDYLTDAQAATLPVAALTAWHAITRAGALRSNARILVEGTGGVSLFALQIAVAAGATVIATSSSEDKLERLRSLGASATVNYQAHSNWGQEVLKLTNGVGVDLAIDIGGATTLGESIIATAMNGVVGIVGLLGGLSATINLAEVFQKNLRLEGIETGSRTMLEEMIGWFAQKRLMPLVERIYPFADSRSAFRHLQNGRHMGKVCIAF